MVRHRRSPIVAAICAAALILTACGGSGDGGIDDPALNAALRQGKTATSPEERKAAYDTVQQRLTELVPVIFTTRAAPSAMMGKNVHGAVQYGNGSLLPEELWLQR